MDENLDRVLADDDEVYLLAPLVGGIGLPRAVVPRRPSRTL